MNASDMTEATKNLFRSSHIWIVFILIISSFVIGTFFLQDKSANELSTEKAWLYLARGDQILAIDKTFADCDVPENWDASTPAYWPQLNEKSDTLRMNAWLQAYWPAKTPILVHAMPVDMDGPAWIINTAFEEKDGTSVSTALRLEDGALTAFDPWAIQDSRGRAESGGRNRRFAIDHRRLHLSYIKRMANYLQATPNDRCAGMIRMLELTHPINTPDTKTFTAQNTLDKTDAKSISVQSVHKTLTSGLPNAKLSNASLLPIEDSDWWQIRADDAIHIASASGHVLIEKPRHIVHQQQGSLLEFWEADAEYEASMQNIVTHIKTETAGKQLADTLLDADWHIVYPGQAPIQAEVVVITDPGCKVCQRMHDDIEALQSIGISLHYAVVPWQAMRQGQAAYQTWRANMRHVWCSEDRTDALTQFYDTGQVEPTDCPDEPSIDESINSVLDAPSMIAREIGVKGTPAFLTQDGRFFQGYRNGQEFLAHLHGAD